ncbi:MAG: PhoH family protein [Planctomycetota bacterium]
MEITLKLPEPAQRLAVTGPAERNLKIIRESLGVHVQARGGVLRLTGESRAVGQAALVLERLTEAARAGHAMPRAQVLDAVAAASLTTPPASLAPAAPFSPPVMAATDPDPADAQTPTPAPAPATPETLDVYLPGKRIRAKTPGQVQYLHALHHHDLTFCIGPAGTGKTYLAVAAAVAMLKAGHVRKLVLVRPAVEAGEKLGFLPGTMQDKVNPYLRPLLDALHDMMEFEHIERFMAHDLIEIVPLAFMRGRTLNDSLIILDEAQNTTKSQMLMFLTRLGHGGKMVVTGDASQIDLDDPRDSGLIDAARRLKRTRGVAFCTLSGRDIVRHALVQRIVEAYEDPRAASAPDPNDSLAADLRTGRPPDNSTLPSGGPARTR